ncbi:MAG TPA: acetolactate synthase large subunit, partial [Pseudorhodoferax sp.]|nr:acetolactate synthase large subunit [Pseudorhodoferax sp.]
MTHSSNGAHSVVQTLVDGGIDVCFANPGTSEMHFMAALDLEPRIRGVLGLFEGVVTGAADGFARMADRPAATLLHLGPGLANGAANIHNARRAGSAMVNIVGDHATYHKRHDAPLTSDVEGIAAPFSDWVRTAESACTVGLDTAAAIQAASGKPGRIATLVLPADTAWNAGPGAGTLLPPRVAPRAGADAVVAAARILRSGEPTAILMTGQVLRSGPLTTASRIAQATGAQLVAQTSNGRVERGQGRVAVQRLPYAVDAALAFLKPYRNLILVGAKAPVAFFAYPDKPSVLTAAGCRVFTLTAPDQDGTEALADLAAELNCTALAPLFLQRQPEIQGSDDGPLNSASIARVVAQSMPENAIVADESVTTG